MTTINNNEDLANAIKNGQDTITVEGDLSKKIIRIKATGKVAWAVAIGAITVAVTAAITVPASGGTSAPIAVTTFVATAPAAVGVLGFSTTVAAISIAVAGGGVAVLNKLRKYSIVSRKGNQLVLKRK